MGHSRDARRSVFARPRTAQPADTDHAHSAGVLRCQGQNLGLCTRYVGHHGAQNQRTVGCPSTWCRRTPPGERGSGEVVVGDLAGPIGSAGVRRVAPSVVGSRRAGAGLRPERQGSSACPRCVVGTSRICERACASSGAVPQQSGDRSDRIMTGCEKLSRSSWTRRWKTVIDVHRNTLRCPPPVAVGSRTNFVAQSLGRRPPTPTRWSSPGSGGGLPGAPRTGSSGRGRQDPDDVAQPRWPVGVLPARRADGRTCAAVRTHQGPGPVASDRRSGRARRIAVRRSLGRPVRRVGESSREQR